MAALWPEGYRENYERGQANAEWLADALESRGYPVVEPVLPLVAADIPREEIDALRAEGWRVSPTASGELRVVCMPHVTREMLEAFLADLDSL
jgi:tyrosine decarboxylase/aspartate 1-decarboxylase